VDDGPAKLSSNNKNNMHTCIGCTFTLEVVSKQAITLLSVFATICYVLSDRFH